MVAHARGGSTRETEVEESLTASLRLAQAAVSLRPC